LHLFFDGATNDLKRSDYRRWANSGKKKTVWLKAGSAGFLQSLRPKEERAGTAEKELIGAADSIADATGIGRQLKSKISPLNEYQF